MFRLLIWGRIIRSMNVEVAPENLVIGQRYKLSKGGPNRVRAFGTLIRLQGVGMARTAFFKFDKFYTMGRFIKNPPPTMPIILTGMGWHFYNAHPEVTAPQAYRGLAANLPETVVMSIENSVSGPRRAGVVNRRTYPARNNMNNPTYYTQNRVNTTLFNGGRRARKNRKTRKVRRT